MLYLIIWTVP